MNHKKSFHDEGNKSSIIPLNIQKAVSSYDSKKHWYENIETTFTKTDSRRWPGG